MDFYFEQIAFLTNEGKIADHASEWSKSQRILDVMLSGHRPVPGEERPEERANLI